MPGISFIYSSGGSLDGENQAISAALDSLLHLPSYKRELYLTTPSYLLAVTGYQEYPIWTFDDDEFYICLEGKIYLGDSSSLEVELKDLASLLFKDSPEAESGVAKHLATTDGDFVLFVLKKDTSEVAILTDAMGHLPLYFCKLEARFLLSREIRFITKLVDDLKVDTIGLAQYFLFAYPLGERCILGKISRLNAGSLVKIHLRSGDIEFKRIFEFNFDHKQYANRSAEDNAKHLVELLVGGCKSVSRSMDDFTNVLGLSGGLDSRVVLLAMRKASMTVLPATRRDGNALSPRDAETARQLTELYNLDWRLFELQPPRFRDALQLLQMKSGVNYLGLSFMLPFLENLRKHYGQKMIYWSGDTGLALRPETPGVPLRNYDDLLNCILNNHKVLDLHDAAGLLQINAEMLRDEIKHVLAGYPEQSLAEKYAHFVVYERGIKWHYEGMDRNRCYFWTSAPLEYTTFVDYAMNCPDEQKKEYRMHLAILKQMSPESCRIKYAQHGIAPASLLFPIMLRIRSVIQKAPRRWRAFAKLAFSYDTETIPTNNLISACIKRQINQCPAVGEYLSESYMEELLPRCNQWQRKLLLTATSLMEDLDVSRNPFEDVLDEYFV